MALPEIPDDQLPPLSLEGRAYFAMSNCDKGTCNSHTFLEGWPETGAITVCGYSDREGQEIARLRVWRVWRSVTGRIEVDGKLTAAGEAVLAAVSSPEWPGQVIPELEIERWKVRIAQGVAS